MAGFVSYDIDDAQNLRQHTQEVWEKTSHVLGFTTARKSVNIQIRFKHGASHKNWLTGQVLPSQAIANMLVNGYRCRKPRRKYRTGKRVPPRPVFDNYLTLYSQDMRNIVVDVFNRYARWTIPERCLIAGEYVMADFKKKIYSGSLGLLANHGDYAIRKEGAGYGDIPLVATKRLFEDLEVVIL